MSDRASEALRQAEIEDQRSAFDLRTHRKPYVTATELAGWLDVDRRTVIRMIRESTLTAVKAGRCWRIPTESARAMFHVEQIPA